MRERTQLVALHQTGRYTVTELAERFQVSRKTAHKWLRRYGEGEDSSLKDRSRAPLGHPNATPEAVVAAVVQAKRDHPTWGPLKLHPGPQVSAEVAAAWPAASTRGAILARHGLTQRRRRRRRVDPYTQPFAACDGPNAVWCADFKGWFRTGDGKRCDPLTITDGYSRYLLCCQGLANPDGAHVRPWFERTFREYGLPQVIRTDNGPPFASVGAGGLSRLSVWWIKLGIVPERIDPGHPEQNGRHERMHRTLKEECQRDPAATLTAQQAGFDRFRQSYNAERPHQALGQRPPAQFYEPSVRPYPAHLTDPCYPSDFEIRRVRSNGQVKWRGELVFVSEALSREAIGVQETPYGWCAYFGPIPLGILDPVKPSLVKLSVAVVEEWMGYTPPIPPQPDQPTSTSVTHVPS